MSGKGHPDKPYFLLLETTDILFTIILSFKFSKKTKLGVVAHTCDPSTQGGKGRQISMRLKLPWSTKQDSQGHTVKPCLKNKNERQKQKSKKEKEERWLAQTEEQTHT